MRARSRLVLVLVPLAGILVAASTALAYQYFSRAQLFRELEAHVGKKVHFVDELVKVYPDEIQKLDGYLRFDTRQFTCAIPVSNQEGVAYLKELAAKRAKLPVEDATPQWIAIYGDVVRPDWWGPVADGAEDGVVPETIAIAVDKVERARQRYFDDPEEP